MCKPRCSGKKIISTNVLSNSRRIDELNKRIDGINQRIDDTNKSVDLIYVESGNIKKEMERLKREGAVTAEILEEKVLLKQ